MVAYGMAVKRSNHSLYCSQSEIKLMRYLLEKYRAEDERLLDIAAEFWKQQEKND